MDERQRQRLLLVAAVIAAAVVSAVATLLAIGGKRQSALAEENERLRTEAEAAQQAVREADNRARRARAQAGELIGHFVDTLRRELQPLARTDIIEDSARQAAEYFESLPPGEITAESDQRHAKTLLQLAWAHYEQGALRESLAAFEKAIALLEPRAREPGAGTRPVDSLAHLMNESALPLVQAGRWDEAEGRHRAALALYEKLLREEPGESGWYHGMAASQFGIAEIARNRALAAPVHVRGDFRAAAGLFDAALGTIKTAVEGHPDDVNYISLQMFCHTNKGQCLIRADDFDAAETEALAASALGERLVEIEPTRKKWRREYATLVNNIGSLLDDRGEHERAAAFLERARKLRTELIAFDPGNANWRAELANSEYNRATNHLERGDIASGAEAAAECLGQMRTVLLAEPGNKIWQDLLMTNVDSLGDLFDALQASAECAKLFETAAATLAELAVRQPEVEKHRARQAQILSRAGRRRKTCGHHQSELAHFQKALTLRLELLRAAPDDVDRLYAVASACGNLGQAYDHNSRSEEALRHLQFGLALYLRVPEGHRNRERYLAMDRRDIGLLRGELGKIPPAPAIVSMGSSWRYWDRAEPPPAGWANIGFDDSAWPEGKAQLGYGDGDEVTTLEFGGDEDNKHASACFRHRFEIADPESVKSLHVSLVRDDGAVVYLNGTEVARDLMPEGQIRYATLATGFTPTETENTAWRLDLPPESPAKLKKGANVIAVSVHQCEAVSSDLSFDLALLKNAPQSDPLEGMDAAALEEMLGLPHD